MAEPNSKRPRTTPRNSSVGDASATSAEKRVSTPYTNLRNLASLIRDPSTPRNLPSNGANASSGNRRTPRTRGGQPTTPHALRAMQARRAAGLGIATPGRERRRSGRQERETPRDLLRNLSRVLARNTAPTEPSPLTEVPQPRSVRRNPAFDDFDIGPDPKVPRLSMSVYDLENSSDAENQPPRLSSVAMESDEPDEPTVGGDDLTNQSIEGIRRARVTNRPSLGIADLARELGMDLDATNNLTEALEEAGFEVQDRGHNTQILAPMDDGESLVVQNTADLHSLLQDAIRRQSRVSDLGIDIDDDEEPDEPTFVFRVPEKMRRISTMLGGVIDAEAQEDAQGLEQAEEEEEDLPEFSIQDLVNMDAEEDDDDDTAALPQFDEFDEDLVETAPMATDTGPIPVSAVEEDPYADLTEPVSGATPTAHQTTLLSTNAMPLAPARAPVRRKPRRVQKISKHGHPYPSLPPSTVKRLAQSFAKQAGASSKLSRDTLEALSVASDWFFEQVGEDLAEYAQHAGRKTIEESDAVALMKRQKQIKEGSTVFSLAKRYLPGELLREVRMPPPTKAKKGTKRKRLETIEEAEEETTMLEDSTVA